MTTADWTVTTEFVLNFGETPETRLDFFVRLVAVNAEYAELVEGMDASFRRLVIPTEDTPAALDRYLRRLQIAPNLHHDVLVALLETTRVPVFGSPPKDWQTLTGALSSGAITTGSVVAAVGTLEPWMVLTGIGTTIFMTVALPPAKALGDGLAGRVEAALIPKKPEQPSGRGGRSVSGPLHELRKYKDQAATYRQRVHTLQKRVRQLEKKLEQGKQDADKSK